MSGEKAGQVVLKVIGIDGNKEDGKVWEWEQPAVLEPTWRMSAETPSLPSSLWYPLASSHDLSCDHLLSHNRHPTW